MTDNLCLKTNKYLEFIVQSYLVGLICFLTEGLNEITLPSEKKKKKTRQHSNWKSTGPILDSLFLNHYPLVWGNSNRLSRFLDFHWEWPVRLDSSLHECLTRLSTEFSPSLFFSFFFSISLSYPFTPWSWNPSSPSSCSCPDLVIAFHFSPALDLCPFASLMKHVFSWPCQPQGLTQAFIRTGQMMVSLDIMSTHRAKRQNKMSSAKGERENRHS